MRSGGWLGVVVGILALSAVGCAGFRGGELEETRPWPPAAVDRERPSIAVSVVIRKTFNGKPYPLAASLSDQVYHETTEVYRSSELFTEVRPGTAAADLTVEVEIAAAETGSKALAYISGCTLCLIPCRSWNEFRWRTTFKGPDGVVRGVIEKEESGTVWFQTLLLFAMPFAYPSSVTRDAIVDLNRSTLLDAVEKGYLRRGAR